MGAAWENLEPLNFLFTWINGAPVTTLLHICFILILIQVSKGNIENFPENW
jgi:hypothetical protein